MAGPWSSCCVGGYSKIFSLCRWNITWTWLRFIRCIHIPYLICRQYIVFSVLVLHLFSLVVGKSSTYASKNPTSIQFDIGYTWFNPVPHYFQITWFSTNTIIPFDTHYISIWVWLKMVYPIFDVWSSPKQGHLRNFERHLLHLYIQLSKPLFP